MGRRCSKSSLPRALLLIVFISGSCFHPTISATSANKNKEEAFGLVVGPIIFPSPYLPGDCPDCPGSPIESPPEAECPESPPPPPPPPPPPEPKCPPPSSPPPPPPPPVYPTPPSLSAELRMAINTIQRFKKRITSDPFGVIKTWTGNNICVDPSKYKGFNCARTKKDNTFRVVGVDFNEFNFYGNNLNIAGFIEELKDTVVFHVNSNNFTGDIPYRISKLPSFYEFDISNNKLTGGFPRAVLGATNLTFLDLRFNQLTGPVPPEVFTLDLDVLFLNNNQFSGTIPENLGKTPVLYLTLANNRLTGRIPASIGQAGNTLLEVLFLGNQLSGCLPYEIGLLKEATVFDASMNELTGLIPHSFGCLAKMEQLSFAHNQLYGEVPEVLCKLANLYNLTLKYNYFTQVGPECRKLIQNKILDVSMNCIYNFPSQRSPAECDAFFSKNKYCPTLSNIPCTIHDSVSEQSAASRATRQASAPSPSYAALHI